MNPDFGVCSHHTISAPDSTQHARVELIDRQSLLVDTLLQEQGIGPKRTSLEQISRHHPSKSFKGEVASLKTKGKNNGNALGRKTRHNVKNRDDVAMAKMIAQMKHELAEIRSEQDLRNEYLQGLGEELREILYEIEQAKAEEQEAIAHAEDMSKEVVEIRRKLDRFQEKIPKLRKKVERKYKKVARLKCRIGMFDSEKQEHLCSVDLLKQYCEGIDTKSYRACLTELRDKKTNYGTKTQKYKRRHGQNMTDWTNVIDNGCSGDEPDNVLNTPRLQRRHWKNQTDWTNLHLQFHSSAILNTEKSWTSQEEGTNGTSPMRKDLNKCSSMPNLRIKYNQDARFGVQSVQKFSSSSDKSQFRRIVRTMNFE